MNTLIRIRGWVTESSVINPKESILEPETIYRLRLSPEDPLSFMELEEAAKRLKQESDDPYKKYEAIHYHQDELIDGAEIVLKSFFQPKLVGDFESVERDDELLGKFVQAVGHLQIFKDGNVFLSVHILEPSIPLNGFDPID